MMTAHTTPAFFKQLYQFDAVYELPPAGIKVWILVDYPQDILAPEESLTFLYKILGALKLQSQYVKVSNVRAPLDLPTQYMQVWAFGTPISAILPALPALTAYKPHTQDEIVYLEADSLESLQQNTALKKELWTVLQTL